MDDGCFHTAEFRASKLCRVCGNFVGTKPKNIVRLNAELKKKLKDHFLVDTHEDTDVHPKQICLKCASKLKNIIKRGSTPSVNVFNFNKYTSRCPVCTPLHKRKTFPTKIDVSPKPKNVWDKQRSKELLEQTFPDFNVFYPNGVIMDHLPPKMLNCSHCSQLIQGPVTVSPCEHDFCVHCLLKLVEGKSMENLSCPKCSLLITSVFPSKKLKKLIETLKAVCGDCKASYTITEEHQCKPSICSQATPATLTDLIKVTREEDITKEMNDAVVHIIKKKMDSSQLPNKGIILHTGGRV